MDRTVLKYVSVNVSVIREGPQWAGHPGKYTILNEGHLYYNTDGETGACITKEKTVDPKSKDIGLYD